MGVKLRGFRFFFFQSFGEGGHDFEDVADDTVIGDFKNRSVRVFVDGHDGARALHADDMLNRAADAQRQIQLWRNRLSRAADLPLHGETALIANRPRRVNLASPGLHQYLRHTNIFGYHASAVVYYD